MVTCVTCYASIKNMSFGEKKIRFVAALGLIKCLKSNNWDCDFRAHLFLSYQLIFIIWHNLLMLSKQTKKRVIVLRFIFRIWFCSNKNISLHNLKKYLTLIILYLYLTSSLQVYKVVLVLDIIIHNFFVHLSYISVSHQHAF